MTKLQYQQEYLGLFVGGIQRFFPEELIDKCCILDKERKSIQHMSHDRFLGVDVARMGGDDTVLASLYRIERKKLRMFDIAITNSTRLPDTVRLILNKTDQYNYKKIYIDATGMGWGVYDPLYEHPLTKRKVVSIENAKKGLDKLKGQMKERGKSLLKTDLYGNLKYLMEQGDIELYNDEEVMASLRSIQIDNTAGEMHIFGNYSHIVEALIRAAWCIKDKSLNILAFC